MCQIREVKASEEAGQIEEEEAETAVGVTSNDKGDVKVPESESSDSKHAMVMNLLVVSLC
jgi:hypothetical protein